MMSAPFRMTLPMQLVLRALLQDPAKELYGLEVCQIAGSVKTTV